jgi:hypothetical protein
VGKAVTIFDAPCEDQLLLEKDVADDCPVDVIKVYIS